MAQTIDWNLTLAPNQPGIKIATGTSGEGYTVSDNGHLVRYDIMTGAQAWMVQPDSLTPVVDMLWHPNGHVVILGSYGPKVMVVAMDPMGQLLWRAQWADSVSSQHGSDGQFTT